MMIAFNRTPYFFPRDLGAPLAPIVVVLYRNARDATDITSINYA